MRTKKGFTLRTICGENILVAEGLENIDYSRIISLNESSAFLWRQVEGKDFHVDTLVSLLTGEYDVDEATARQDATALARQWVEAGIVSGD